MARKVAKLRTRNHKVVLNRSAGGDVGISIFLVLFGLFMFIPMYYAIIQSLKPLDELWMYPPRFYVANPTLRNFSDMFKAMTDSWVPFSRYIFNTVFISVGGTFGNLVCGSLAAYAVSKIKFPGRAGLQKMVRLALMFHATVGSIVNFMTMSALHLIDTYWAIIIPACGSTLGMFLMMQFMESSVPDIVLESARLDGASEIRTYWTIAMPMVKPAWLTLIIFSVIAIWNNRAATFIYSEDLKTLPYALQQLILGGVSRAGVGAAVTLFMMIVPISIFLACEGNVIETMASSGIKD